VAGSDPSGGAGLQADLVTFATLGVHGMGCVTALTVQNTRGVHASLPVDAEFVAAQLEALLSDLGTDALKTGMLGSADVVDAVAATLRAHGEPALVCDPVLASTGGEPLLGPGGLEALRRELLPLTRVVTPNLEEAALLLDWEPARVLLAPEDTCRALLELGPTSAVLKGGHAGGALSEDLFFDGVQFVRLPARRIDTRNTHGTGCAFSAALAAQLALAEGDADLAEAARRAKTFVTGAIEGARERRLGRGAGPLDLTWPLRD